jgi:predicted enzyme related to lactoylglutathione lyase
VPRILIYLKGGNIMPRVVRFEIPAKDPDRAVKLYSEVFNWKIER